MGIGAEMLCGAAGYCQETLDPCDGERLWECVWRRVLLLGKVNVELSCHSHQHRLKVGTWPQGEQGPLPAVPLLPPRWWHHDAKNVSSASQPAGLTGRSGLGGTKALGRNYKYVRLFQRVPG